MGIGLNHGAENLRVQQFVKYEEDEDCLNYYIEKVKEISKKHHISFSEAISVLNVLEKRTFSKLYIDNGDVYDEDMFVIGKKIEELLEIMHNIATNIEDIKNRNK